MELSACVLQPALSDLHGPWEAQATVEGPPLDFDKLSNPLVKPPRGNKREASQGCVSQNHSLGPSFVPLHCRLFVYKKTHTGPLET